MTAPREVTPTPGPSDAERVRQCPTAMCSLAGACTRPLNECKSEVFWIEIAEIAAETLTLADIVSQAADRFDARPIDRASVEARRELAARARGAK